MTIKWTRLGQSTLSFHLFFTIHSFIQWSQSWWWWWWIHIEWLQKHSFNSWIYVWPFFYIHTNLWPKINFLLLLSICHIWKLFVFVFRGFVSLDGLRFKILRSFNPQKKMGPSFLFCFVCLYPGFFFLFLIHFFLSVCLSCIVLLTLMVIQHWLCVDHIRPGHYLVMTKKAAAAAKDAYVFPVFQKKNRLLFKRKNCNEQKKERCLEKNKEKKIRRLSQHHPFFHQKEWFH